ncbi:hypothetical protein [Sphingomonas solaris]|uniref:Uncharacterized protein n=1 Tax=Alterirhizorhabdus solaris TaxID=2529389 RepID=A0A558R6G6_9SPHN|nr:hypothetical protein [Sphingomonas solaris]TVV74973.1 hypothetical protein FOY91_08320 [Sphingomonas solaris]
MTHTLTTRRASTLWIMLLTLASAATTLAFACATPFPALAALAAAHMRRADGVWLALAAGACSQVIGFGLLGYPHDPATVARGVAIGVAAVAGALAAHAAVARAPASPALRLAVGFGAAFVAFKAALLLASLAVSGLGGGMEAGILARQIVRNGAILLGLLTLYHGVIDLGVAAPRTAPRRVVA